MKPNYKKLVKEVLAKEAREEALQILTIGSENQGAWDKYINDVSEYYEKGKDTESHSEFNIVCTALDFSKYFLVEAGLMEQGPNDHFGAIDWMFSDNNILEDED